MKPLTLSCIALFVGSMSGSAVYAQELFSPSIVIPTTAAGQRYPIPGFSLSESQRRGVRWGAQIGIFAGLGIAWIAAGPDDADECPEFECLGRAVALPFYLAAGMLGGMVAGGAVGLGVGTIVDDGGESQSTLELRVRIAP